MPSVFVNPMSADSMKVSVIVPTYCDAEQLELCLKALEHQTLASQNYEVIVVNNNVNDNLEPLIARFSKAILVVEPKPGSYSARNAGLDIASGEIIAFTDADCIPEPDWLEKGRARLVATPNCGLVAGNIRLFYRDPDAPNPCELYEQLFAFPQKRFLEQDHYGATANVFTYRKVIDDVGGFDSELKSGGDLHWGQKVYAAGYAMVYAPEVCINHPARSGIQELHKKLRRVVKGHCNLIHETSTLPNDGVYTPWRFYGGLVGDLLFPFRSVPMIVTDDRLETFSQRLIVIGMSIFMRYLKAFERIGQTLAQTRSSFSG